MAVVRGLEPMQPQQQQMDSARDYVVTTTGLPGYQEILLLEFEMMNDVETYELAIFVKCLGQRQAIILNHDR